MNQQTIDDVPFEVRAALYEISLGKRAKLQLTKAVEKLNLAPHYQMIWGQIRGNTNMTPNTLIQLCKVYNDFTPINMLFAHHEIDITIETAHEHSTNLALEVLEAGAKIGELQAELVSALVDRNVTAKERAAIASRAQAAINELRDVLAVATKGRE